MNTLDFALFYSKLHRGFYTLNWIITDFQIV